MSQATFLLLMPLSNWLMAFDRYASTYDKRKVPGVRYPQDTYLLAEHEQTDVYGQVLAKSQDLVERLGIQGDRVVGLRATLPVLGPNEDVQSNRLAARPNDVTGTGVGWRWPSPVLPVESVGWIHEDGRWEDACHEHLTAAAFALPDQRLVPWNECVPRSFSVLPIAQACNAKCQFCFSKSSISDLPRERRLPPQVVGYWARRAQEHGASRAVITGGGEPTLLVPSQMTQLISTLRQALPYTLLISNGAVIDAWRRQSLDKAQEILGQWQQSGLSRIAISRHGTSRTQDERIMGLDVDVAGVVESARAVGLPVRGICVLQKGGVETVLDVKRHLERAASEGMDEVCFKELYVAALSENPLAGAQENQYCKNHQIPLSMVLEAMGTLDFQKVGTLPWGSPFFEGRVAGKTMRVAAYTEPSVGWERTRGQVRSWNLMSDGSCMASLEDPASRLEGHLP